uniref:Uncharacterized protein n=1 Tax=Guillardia theta TaxID=55529 RepID=A0A7S4MZ43_GUITH
MASRHFCPATSLPSAVCSVHGAPTQQGWSTSASSVSAPPSCRAGRFSSVANKSVPAPGHLHDLNMRTLSSTVSARRSACDVQGRSSKTGRIRPAVGDQAGSRSMKEDDAENVKVQQFIAALPSSQRGHGSEDKEVKWLREGRAAKTFELPCASGISRLSVRCTSEDVRQDLINFMEYMLGKKCRQGDSFYLNDVEVQLDTIDQDWVKKIRTMRSFPNFAKLEDIEFSSCSIGSKATERSLSEREIPFVLHSGSNNVYDVTVPGSKKGLLNKVNLVMSKDPEVLPSKLLFRCFNEITHHRLIASSLLLKEVVYGAAWPQVASFELLFDRIAGRQARSSHGIWKLPRGPAMRMVPSDESGMKCIVLLAKDLEEVKERLRCGNYKFHKHPNFISIMVS